MIRVENLTKAFGQQTVLKGITAEIHAGEVVSIIGPSGTGKSTFLRCLNLLDQPTGGKTPRHFGLDPTGTLLAMGNQGSDSIVLARIDPATGALTSSPRVASAPSPVCHVFLPPTGK